MLPRGWGRGPRAEGPWEEPGLPGADPSLPITPNQVGPGPGAAGATGCRHRCREETPEDTGDVGLNSKRSGHQARHQARTNQGLYAHFP